MSHALEKKYIEIQPFLLSEEAKGIKKRLIAAIILAESYGIPYMCRYENRYKDLFLPDHYAKINYCKYETMILIQKTSWGLMQVMGANYYYHGGNGWCTEMIDPFISVKYGCRILQVIMRKHQDAKDIYAVYNRGSLKKKSDGTYVNQERVNRFSRFYDGLYFVKE